MSLNTGCRKSKHITGVASNGINTDNKVYKHGTTDIKVEARHMQQSHLTIL
jgi:hypothetical protein